MDAIRTLVLSGGGGRGAFHAGVYNYLLKAAKEGVDEPHSHVWFPDIVVGTSIGAVNGAAIAQGISPQRLENVWLKLREKDIQGLPPGMKFLARWVAKRALEGMIGVPLERVPPGRATSPKAEEFWPPLPFLPRWVSEKLTGRWLNLLDTGPLAKTLQDEFRLDMDRIAKSDPALLITATNVQTGERVIFSNRTIYDRATGERRKDVVPGISLQRILASCSIPIVYPWTYDEETDAYYWDGALVANTPMGAALDAVRDVPVEVPMEVVVVLMTPWWEAGEVPPARSEALPDSFGEAITWTLDWALLSSFRERLQLVEAYNRLARRERQQNRSQLRYREVKTVIVAPQDFFPVARIIDYDEQSALLIEEGYKSAQQAFQRAF
ncbi:MAG: hypothetical protein MAG431_00961 [Chloroflexi bacterium]|nr:hypothetical protein [Chloroflexota bacterium]